MQSYELNFLPGKIKSREITKKQAVNIICTFIINNYPIFGLHKYDEDFREDIFVYFLEHGEHLLDTYSEDTADFFTFLYSNIISYINTRRRSLARSYVKERLTVAESMNLLEDTNQSYESINYKSFELAQTPYSYKPISVESLKQIFEPLSKDSSDKKLLVLAMKSSFYISHEQIKKICSIYKIKIDDMYKTIEYCKRSIDKRSTKHSLVIERRNSAYFQHKKCEYELLLMRENDTPQELQDDLVRKNRKHKKNMNIINSKFEHGYLHLRPTNRTIAEILGICERQVTYYINCAKKDLEKNKKD